MPMFLWQASHTSEGTKGLIKEGGTKRRATVQKMVEGVGGKVHAFYYAFGEWDVVGIAEFPDHATATSAALAVNSSGMVSLHSTVLITPEDVDAATKKPVSYRAPGA